MDHVTFSQTGGAGEVARLLATSQQELGIEARLLSLISRDLRSEPFAQSRITVAAALDEFIVSNHSNQTMLSLYRSRLSQLSADAIRKDSIVHLHWLPGVLTHTRVRELLDEGRKVVWTLHDMAPFTGVCHHANGCDGFESSCSDCPQVKSFFNKTVEINLSKKLFDGAEKNLILVAPTPWLAKQAQRSLAFRNQRIKIIDHPIRPEFLKAGIPRSIDRAHAEVVGDVAKPLTLTAVASDLQNPAKGMRDLIRIVTRVRQIDQRVSLQLVGKRGGALHNPINGISWLGEVDTEGMVEIARASDLLVSASKAESAGLIVREFGAVGVPTLALRSGGIADLIKDGESGILASDLGELASRLGAIANLNLNLHELGSKAQELAAFNNPARVSKAYLSAYKELN